MDRRRDPIERASDGDRDLYDVSTWDPRSPIDRLAYAVYAAISYGTRTIVLVVTLAITLSLLVTPALIIAEDPPVGVFFALSVVPAGALALYIWYADVTTAEPLPLLVATFLLSVLFATFAALVNSIGSQFVSTATFLGSVLFFYLVVGPIEETVKLLAVRVYAYRSNAFNAVIDGAVYGAVAGLGFAAIENAIYIGGYLADADVGLYAAATQISATRALAGPGHVIYSAIAGYYLGLAKFNPRHAGPLVVKGLLVAAFVHGTYNVTVGIAPRVIAALTGIGSGLAFIAYVVGYDLLIAYYLYRKIARYRRTYREVGAGGIDVASEETEFEPSNRS